MEISNGLKAVIVSASVSLVMFAGHLTLKEANAQYEKWLDSKIEPRLESRLAELNFAIAINDKGAEVLKAGSAMTCKDWNSAALLYKIQSDSCKTSVESIRDYVNSYLVKE